MAYYIWKSYKLPASPFVVFAALSKHKNCFFLDSSRASTGSRNYSILGIDPFFTLKSKAEDPFPALREKMAAYEIKEIKTGLPFSGGAVGYLAYDLGLILEKKVKRVDKPDLGLPDCYFNFYNSAVLIDHARDLLHIFCAGIPEKSPRSARMLAEVNFKKILGIISAIKPDEGIGKIGEIVAAPAKLRSNFTRTGYLRSIKKAKEYIKTGDIYQVNLAQEFQSESRLSAVEIYRRLRCISPSEFSAYLDTGDFQILSSSPERFLSLENDLVATSPMKGTRGRSSDKAKDRALKSELLRSQKDKAELIMIVDLERNDLGRVCDYDSIAVKKIRQMEEYSTVFQTTATVEGKLHKSKDRIDLLRACFPGGSITGCPKIRSMEIIEELEPSRRAIYTGCLGYLSFCGRMEFNILIRTILKKGRKLYFSAGGGIVADSLPEKEYEETLVKARGMMQAING